MGYKNKRLFIVSNWDQMVEIIMIYDFLSSILRKLFLILLTIIDIPLLSEAFIKIIVGLIPIHFSKYVLITIYIA